MKTIIEMARKTGLESEGYWEFDLIRFKRFAALVRADEREECAKVCDAVGEVYNKPQYLSERVATQWCAERIRARGNT